METSPQMLPQATAEKPPKRVYTDLEIRTINQEQIRKLVSYCSQLRQEAGYKSLTYEGLTVYALRVYKDSLERRAKSRAKREIKL